MFRLSTLLVFMAAAGFAQSPCDQLKLSFPDATVTSIQFIPAGPFKAPPRKSRLFLPRNLVPRVSAPACRDVALFDRPRARGSRPLRCRFRHIAE
jgi:hypothetical protein